MQQSRAERKLILPTVNLQL